jgi:DNA-binding transcriptional regulator YiaG
MSTSRFTKSELKNMAWDLVALEKEAKGIHTGRFKWQHYPVSAKPSEVRQTRRTLGFSRKAFAAVVGVSPITIKAWEIGQRSPDGPATKLLRAMRMKPSLAALFGKV